MLLVETFIWIMGSLGPLGLEQVSLSTFSRRSWQEPRVEAELDIRQLSYPAVRAASVSVRPLCQKAFNGRLNFRISIYTTTPKLQPAPLGA